MSQRTRYLTGTDAFWHKWMTLTALGIREVMLSAEYAFREGNVNIVLDCFMNTSPTWKRPLTDIAAFHRMIVQ